MTRRAPLAVALVLLAGCPDAKTPTATPAPPGNSTPARVDAPPPPPAPPPRPREGWGAVGVGSTFETLTKTKFENPDLPSGERTTTQTVVGFDPDGVRVRVVTSGGGVTDPEQESKFAFKALEADPDAKKPEATRETVTVAGKSYECDVTTETAEGTTTKTWRTKALPVPVKIEVKGEGYQSTSELVKAEVK